MLYYVDYQRASIVVDTSWCACGHVYMQQSSMLVSGLQL